MPKEQLETVLSALLAASRTTLDAGGDLTPFGGGLDQEGRVLEVAPRGSGTPVDLAFDDVIVTLRAGIARGEYAAAGVVSDVRLDHETSGQAADAVRVHLEDGVSDPLDVFLPYLRTPDGAIRYGEMIAMEGDRELFPR